MMHFPDLIQSTNAYPFFNHCSYSKMVPKNNLVEKNGGMAQRACSSGDAKLTFRLASDDH